MLTTLCAGIERGIAAGRSAVNIQLKAGAADEKGKEVILPSPPRVFRDASANSGAGGRWCARRRRISWPVSIDPSR